jgi:uroporphyrin-3 C-methyltransferase
VLLTNFNQDNSQVKALSERLEGLKNQPVSVMTPDLAQSLSAVQAYLARRHMTTDAPSDSNSQPVEAKQGISP